MSYRKLLTIIGLAGWAAVSVVAQPAAATPQTSNLPPFGLGSTETARINLTNVAPTASAGTPASCTGTVSFVNASGATIGSAAPFTIASNVTSSFSLPFASAGLTGIRGVIRGVVQVTRTSTSHAPCSLLISLETFDTSSGATHLFLPSAESFGPTQFVIGGRP
jgi:hypothetical protein